MFVPAQDGANGYWLLFDEIGAADADTVHTALHPNSAAEPAVEGDRLAYTTPVGGPRPRSDNGVRLTTAYGTRPSSVETRRGALADWRESFVGTCLYATYPTAKNGPTQLVTALIPHDDGHGQAGVSRLSGERFSGIVLQQGETTHRAVELDGATPVAVGGAEVAGRAALLRDVDGEPGLYFVRRGTRLSHGSIGFHADEAISVALRDGAGSVVAPMTTTVRFDQPGIAGARIDERTADIVGSGEGHIEISVPAGRHDIELV